MQLPIFISALLFTTSSAFAADVVVSKAKFTDEFKVALPASFCGEKTFFRACFDTTAETCKKAATDAAASCIAEMDKEIPAQLHQPSDGQTWGKKVGTCAGKKYATDQQKIKKDSADCNDAAKWQ